MTLFEEIYHLISDTLNTDEEVTNGLTRHLMSDAVGVTKLEELGEVEKDMLLSHLSPIKANKLMKVFERFKGNSSPEARPTQPPTNSQPSSSTQSTSASKNQTMTVADQGSVSTYRGPREVLEDRSYFKFTVQWSELPQEPINRINEAQKNKMQGSPNDIKEIKLAIAKKLASAYTGHKEIYPGSNKYPGRRIYADVTKQVENKFGDAVKTTIKGVVVKDGMASFFKMFETCVENLMRNQSEPSVFTKSKVKKGKKVIGVQVDAYNPPVQESSREVMTGTKEHLKNLSSLSPNELDWRQIRDDLKNTYSLQREEILLATDAVVNQSDDNQDEDDVGMDLLSMEKLKMEWPFLFTVKGIEIHHELLTKRSLGEKSALFIKQHLELLLHFLQTSTKSSNLDNLVVRLRVEQASHSEVSIQNKFLMMIQMLSNNFKESNTFPSLFVPVEKTVQPPEFRFTVLEKIASPCIVAQDMNIYKAKKYFVCSDRVPLVETDNPKDALDVLMELSFVLDLEYPQLPLTFEFLERYVVELGLLDTRVKNKKGKQLVVLSEQVKQFIENYETFAEELKKALPAYFDERQENQTDE